ncbi:unnamed protein product, partial [Vitis vinifera]|uniref:PNPLA domain-containing protein n=1 Tax=Vitis vinifera TaxID=29760 RepID=E0CP90_VITVI
MEKSLLPQIQPPTYGNLVTILSIDGGGIRGIIPATILACLEPQLQYEKHEVNRSKKIMSNGKLCKTLLLDIELSVPCHSRCKCRVGQYFSLP